MEISSCSRDDVSVIYILGPTRTSQIYLFIKLNPSVVVKNKESLNAVKVSLKPDFFCTKDVSDIVSLVFFMVACIKVIFNFQKKEKTLLN